LSTRNLITTFGIYIHWPYCLSKCPYCDFNSHVRPSIDHDTWFQAALKELEYYHALTSDRTVSSIFFGGGTPSLLPPSFVEGIIQFVTQKWSCLDDLEITLEANPTSSEAERFKGYRIAGVNRLSMGIQALNDEDLRFLGREHSSDEARKCIDMAAKSFERYSFDLIYARPGQSLKAWENELKEALNLGSSHLSLYQLTIEQGTAFWGRFHRGDFQLPDEDLAADLYLLTDDITQKHGLNSYEVSNYAKEGQASRHNLLYWRYQDYIGVGPGAHGRLFIDDQKQAFSNIKSPELWQTQVFKQGHGLDAKTPITDQERLTELLMMGFRLKEGIDLNKFQETMHREFQQCFSSSAIQDLQNLNLMYFDENFVCLTPQGRLKINAVLKYLLP
jgi:putative oxygen-independent coproporphyrinogen III oxidase